MIILGIESSCDETAAAIVKDGTQVLSSVVASSQEIQQKYGGIVPEQAAREQIRCIIPVIQGTINNSKTSVKNIGALAITVGPGLIGSLLIGIETAKTLSFVWQKPIVPVNHLIAHIYANFINLSPITNHQSLITFPALCLIVSGGHTELVLMKNHGQLQLIGSTRDDAAGECFDKCSRLLQLGYPGGPAVEFAASNLKTQISKLKSTIKNLKLNLPRPMINDNSFDFSFSGLKTAVLRLVKNSPNFPDYPNLIAYELQEAITDVLVQKTLKAAQQYRVKSILIGGGVAANQRLRDKFELTTHNLQPTTKLFIPDKKLCTDNAAAIATAAYFNYQPVPWSCIQPNPSMEIVGHQQ